MACIGIFYGSTSGKVENIAFEIQKILGKENADVIDIKTAIKPSFRKYKYLIFGTSTEYGNIQKDWVLKIPLIKKLDYTHKKVAIFGLGDQKLYPDTFADGMGVLFDLLNDSDVDIIGNWYPHGYVFQRSKALVNGSFVGLVLDENFQPNITQIRLNKWTDYLKSQIKEVNFPQQ